MSITQALCTSFKKELADGLHDFTTAGHTFKMALYTSSADLDASTTAYSATNEISGTGYTAGGATITNINPTSSGTTGIVDMTDVSWAGATFTARGALIYNTSSSNAAVCVLDFGADKTATAETFTVQFPTADAVSGFIRLA